jgi:hypothetical protein
MKKITKQNIADVKKIMGRRIGDPIVARLFTDEVFPEYKGFDGPLPDVIGYKQHSSECASDAIQESLLFADGLREYTQPILYGMTETQISVRSKLALKYYDWERFTAYFEFIQKRFKNHYDVLNYIRTHKINPQKYQTDADEVCALDPIFSRKLVQSPEAGILALKRLKREGTYSDSGMTGEFRTQTISSILQWLKIPFESVAWKDAKRERLASIIVNLSNGYTKPEGDIYWYTSVGHATAFFKMLDKWYYYDNEGGFYEVADELLNDFLDPAKNCYIFFSSGKEFKPYFFKGGANPTHVWNPAKGWDADIDSVTNPHPTIAGRRVYTRMGTIQRPNFHSFNAIQKVGGGSVPYNLAQCKIAPGVAGDEDTAIANVKKLINCIYENKHSNSSIFEDLYHYTYDNLALLHKDPETLLRITSTLPTVISQPVCSPIMHYWVWKLQSTILKKYPDEVHEWFVMPTAFAMKNTGAPAHAPTPPEVREALMRANEEQKKKEEEAKGVEAEPTPKKLTPCKGGQIRDKVTRKCRDKTPEELEAERLRKEELAAKKAAEPPKPKRQVLSPCPPGQVRNAKTKKCRPRFQALSPCPPGQIRDKKTKKCREVAHIKL